MHERASVAGAAGKEALKAANAFSFAATRDSAFLSPTATHADLACEGSSVRGVPSRMATGTTSTSPSPVSKALTSTGISDVVDVSGPVDKAETTLLSRLVASISISIDAVGGGGETEGMSLVTPVPPVSSSSVETGLCSFERSRLERVGRSLWSMLPSSTSIGIESAVQALEDTMAGGAHAREGTYSSRSAVFRRAVKSVAFRRANSLAYAAPRDASELPHVSTQPTSASERGGPNLAMYEVSHAVHSAPHISEHRVLGSCTWLSCS